MFTMAMHSHAQGESIAPLTLDETLLRVLQHNPSLRVFEVRMRGLEGLRQSARLRPELVLEAEVENIAGQGELSGLNAAEQTVALSSVLELGGERNARVAVASAQVGRLQAEREATALEVLGGATNAFIGALAAQRQLELAEDAVALAQSTYRTVQRRAQAGAAPDAEVLRAKADLAQARLALAQLKRAFEAKRVELAIFWGATRADFSTLKGDLYALEVADDFDSLFARLERSAALAVYASEERIRQAELRLARAAATPDIGWSLGVRRMEETGDSAFVAGVSIPLFSGQRGRGDVRSAESRLHQTRLERDSALLSFRAKLFGAYQARQQNVEVVDALKDEIIPALTLALDQTRKAYELGRYSYLDLAAVQKELLEAREALIQAAASALAQGALIEQLTAEPLTASTARQHPLKNP
jgi:cobalt-zinc-cadmium efflux system outer membrane protein